MNENYEAVWEAILASIERYGEVAHPTDRSALLLFCSPHHHDVVQPTFVCSALPEQVEAKDEDHSANQVHELVGCGELEV